MMRPLLSLLLLALLPSAAAAVEFEIFQSDYRPVRIAVVAGGSADEEELRRLYNVVVRDLESSRSFIALDPMSFLPTPEEALAEVDYGDWRLIGAETLALCALEREGDGWHLTLTLHDPFRERRQLERSLSAGEGQLRRTAHEAADAIYEAVTGVPGHFRSRILYVRKHDDRADLVRMDQDGYARTAVAKNFTLLLSPDWSPEHGLVALNTYVGNRPRLEIFELGSGERRTFGAFKGLNSTPEFSPDGRYIAAALSHTGNTEIHLYDLKTGRWRQLTRHPGIDTSPTWSPDGRQIAFTSDRDGSPQIYRMRLKSGQVNRVTRVASYNTSPAWSPRGNRIALVTLKNWEYALATVRLDGSDVRYLATAPRLESPAWSPNAQMLLFSAETHGHRRVYRVPSWGGDPVPITPAGVDASDPAWSR